MKGSDIVARRPGDLLTAKVDGELIGMSVEEGTCYGFNAVGTRLWELIEEPRSFDSLCESLVAEFDVGEAECREQVAGFIDELRRECLVTVRPAG